MPQAGIWELSLGIHGTQAEAEEIQERIARLMCPDPDHEPPCPIPWSLALRPASALDDQTRALYDDLVIQAEVEQGRS